MPDTSPLNIPPLSTIKDLREGIMFLENDFNRTQIRNTCYLLQLGELLLQINNNYNIYKGGWHIFLYNYLRVCADACEGILYCFKARHLGVKPTGANNLSALMHYVKAINSPQPVIDRECRRGIERLVSYRNDLHPDRQVELHIKVIDQISDDERRLLINLPEMLIGQMKKYYNS